MVRGGYGPWPHSSACTLFTIGRKRNMSVTYDQADGILQRCAFGFGDQPHVAKCLPDPSLFTGDESVGRWIDAAHACNEQETAGARCQTQVPVGLIAPAGVSVLTPILDVPSATAGPPRRATVPSGQSSVPC